MNLKEVRELLSVVVDAYPNFDVTPTRVKLWLQQLNDIPADHAMDKLINHIRKSKFMPTIADLREDYEPPRQLTDDERMMEERFKQLQAEGFYADE